MATRDTRVTLPSIEGRRPSILMACMEARGQDAKDELAMRDQLMAQSLSDRVKDQDDWNGTRVRTWIGGRLVHPVHRGTPHQPQRAEKP